MTPVMRIESRRLSNDCAIWALATYLGIAYERVFSTVDRLGMNPEKGLTTEQIRRVARTLKRPLVRKRDHDLSEDYGILITTGHAAVTRNGLLFDTDASVWEIDTWFAHYPKEKIDGLFVAKE